MKKLFLAVLLIFVSIGVVSRQSYIGRSWPKNMVAQCTNNTTVFFVEAANKKNCLGSGVLISREGRVLTAAHLFDEKPPLKITMIVRGGQEYEMQVTAVDTRRDLALVEPVASAQQFRFARLQKSDDLYVGQDVLIIGHPYGDYWTVTTGIISRLSWYMWYLCRMIETTALVNPGNSGGPVFNMKGEVIGIVSAMKVTIFRQPVGIGIIIPIQQIHLFLAKQGKKAIQIRRYRLGDLKWADYESR